MNYSMMKWLAAFVLLAILQLWAINVILQINLPLLDVQRIIAVMVFDVTLFFVRT